MTSNPLWFSRQLLSTLNTQVSLYHAERIPHHEPVVVVSNHRSFMDPFLLMATLATPVHFACHRYMSRVPVLNEMVQQMGAFSLDSHSTKHRVLFDKASEFLNEGQTVGIFPEGAKPMVQATSPEHMSNFHRGFAHLLLRSPVSNITVLPVAIASRDESSHPLFPVRMLHWVDPSEPAFNQEGWHPFIVYHQVNVLIGKPICVTDKHREDYRGRQAREVVQRLSHHCQSQVSQLLQTGFQV